MSEILVAVFDRADGAARTLERLRAAPERVPAELAEACALRREADGRIHLEETVGVPGRRRLPHGFWQRLVEHLLARDGEAAEAARCFERPFCEAVARAVGPGRSAVLLLVEQGDPEPLARRLAAEGARILRAPAAGGAAQLARRLEEALLEIPPASELARLAEAVETERLLAARARRRAEEAARRAELLRLRSETVEPRELEAILRRCAEAARHGAGRLVVLAFPAELLDDRGRRIVQGEPDWPASLTGKPLALYRLWESRLRPLGYRLAAEVLGYEDGVPATLGLVLDWSGTRPGSGLEQAQEPLGGQELAP